MRNNQDNVEACKRSIINASICITAHLQLNKS